MFKTTPRSVLMGGNLILKSAGRIRVNENGEIERYADTLEEEDFNSVPNPHGEGMIDRAPTGSGPQHRHMIDALLHTIMRIIAKNGFEVGDEIKNEAINGIDHMISRRNGRVIETEGEDSPNILSGFRSKRWRTLRGSGHVDKKQRDEYFKQTGRHLPVTTPLGEGDEPMYVRNSKGEIVEVPHQINFFGKKGNVDSPDSDKGNSIDSVFNPIWRDIKPVMESLAEHFVNKYGYDLLGDWRRDRALKRFYRSHVVPLSAVSEGTVFGLREDELDDLDLEKIPSRFLRHYEDYAGKRYALPAAEAKEFGNLSHSGFPVPKYALEAVGAGKKKGEGSYDRLAAMQQFLQSIEGMEHMSPEDKLAAKDLLAREVSEGALRANVKSPKLSALFGIGTRSDGDGDKRTDTSSLITGGIRNPKFIDLYTGLGLNEEQIKVAARNSAVSNSMKDTTSKDAADAAEKFHALHLALTDQYRQQGVENAYLAAAEAIRNHGQLKSPGNQQQVEDAQLMVDLHNRVHGHSLQFEGGTQGEARPAPAYSLPVDTPYSQALQGTFGTLDLNMPIIQQSFETLQTMSAIKDDRVMKHVKKGYSINSHNDILSFSMSVGITTQDVHGIMATKGDWGVVAKQWNVSPTIVKATKVTFGGA